jgi:hypothetical protein
LAFMVATTVTGMGDGLLSEYVLDGCPAYLRGCCIGQPMSTQIVRPAAVVEVGGVLSPSRDQRGPN